MGKLSKKKSIRLVFLGYVIKISILAVVSLTAVLMLFNCLFLKGIIRNADYYEKWIENHEKELETMPEEELKLQLSSEYQYAVWGTDASIKLSSLSEKKVKQVQQQVFRNERKAGGQYYKLIQRGKEQLVILYPMHTTFVNPAAARIIPNVDFLFYGGYLCFIVLVFIFFSKRFGRRVQRELDFLSTAAQQIQNENLEFTIEESNFIEFDTVLQSLDKLKENLKDSLQKQWVLEKAKKDQIGALGHDLKTPITVVRGNAELLEETKLDAEQQDYVAGILKNTAVSQNYVQILLDLNRGEELQTHKFIPIPLKELLQEVFSELSSVFQQKNITLKEEIDEVTFLCDPFLLKRAIINLLLNALDYTPNGGSVGLSLEQQETTISLSVEDSGKGFSKEDLKFGMEQFYQGDKSRSSDGHYGMGLYIASTICKIHGGILSLGESVKFLGAKVTMEFPYREGSTDKYLQ